jgi:hypothetical protein
MKDLKLYNNLVNEDVTAQTKQELINRVFENTFRSDFKKMAEGGGVDDSEVYSPYEFLYELMPKVYGRDYVVSDDVAIEMSKKVEEKKKYIDEKVLVELQKEGASSLYELSNEKFIEEIEIERRKINTDKCFISESELQAYIFCHPELNASDYVKEIKSDKEEFIKKGLVMVDYDVTDGVQYVYKYDYLSGDVYKKISALRMYSQRLIDGGYCNQDQIDFQIQMLNSVKPLQAEITTSNFNAIYIHPKSKFSEKIFKVEPTDLINIQLRGRTSLMEAFKYWISNEMDNSLLKNADSKRALIRFYVDLERPSENQMDARTFINARRRAFLDGDRIFNVFLNTELNENCKMRLQIQWNELYNNFVQQQFNKVPIALRCAKTWKTGSPFIPNESQVQSVQYIKNAGSGLLAYGVGVGKTASSILNVSYAIDNNFAKKPIFVVPNATYEKWKNEIVGGQEVTYIVKYKENGEELESVFTENSKAKKFAKEVGGEITEKKITIGGILPHLKKYVGLYNLNEEIVMSIKTYTQEEKNQIKNMDLLLELLETINPKYTFNDESINRKIKTYYDDFELIDLIRDYNEIVNEAYRKATKKKYIEFDKFKNEFKPTIFEYFSKLMKKYRNELPYILGTLKEFEDNTIFLLTFEGLERLGLKRNNVELNYRDNDTLFGKLFNEFTQGESISNFINQGKESVALETFEEVVYGVNDKRKLSIEEFKFDFGVFDESHNFKKVFLESKGEPKMGWNNNFAVTGRGTIDRDDRKYTIGSGERPTPRALSGWFLTRYIQETNSGNNTIQLTATPFTNKPAEIYSMLALTNYKRLVAGGYRYMQDFFDLFMSISFEMTLTPSQKIVRREVLVGFNNLPQMRNLIYNIMDYKSGEDANIKRPKKVLYPSEAENRNTILPATAQQEELFKDIKRYIKGEIAYEELCSEFVEDVNIEELSTEELLEYIENYGSETQKERFANMEKDNEEELISLKQAVSKLIEQEKKDVVDINVLGDDNTGKNDKAFVRILKGISIMKQVTLSPYLSTCSKLLGVEPTAKEYVESSPKLLYTAQSIKSIHDYENENGTASGKKHSGIVIYMNIGVHPSVKGKKWSEGGFEKIKKYFVEQLGYKDSDISIVSGKSSQASKEKEKNRFLAGQSIILIGSSTISTGVDLQNNASALFLCSFDWNPTDNEQIAGRVHRQGNPYAFVRIVYPMIMNSADVVIFGLLQEKTNRVKSIWDKDEKGTTLDLKDFDPKKLMKELLDDPEDMTNLTIEEMKTELEDEKIILENRLDSLRNIADDYSTFSELKPIMLAMLTIWDSYKKEKTRNEGLSKYEEKRREIQDDDSLEEEVQLRKLKDLKNSTYDYKNDPEGRYVIEDFKNLNDDELLVKINTQFRNSDSSYQNAKSQNQRIGSDVASFMSSKFPDYAEGIFSEEDRAKYSYSRNKIDWDYDYRFNNLIDRWKGAKSNLKKTADKLAVLGIPFEGIDEAKQLIVDRIEKLAEEITQVKDKKNELFERFTLEYLQKRREMPTIKQKVDEFSEMNFVLNKPLNVFKIDTAKIVEVPEQLKEMPKEPTTIVKPKTKVVDVKVEEEKQTDAEYYEEVISSYETLKELEENEETIKYYDEVIESYKILLELV